VTVDFTAVTVTPGQFVGAIDGLVADVAVFAAGRNAQDEGYDAVCVDTISDAGVDALRAHLDIPVVGPGRVAFNLACMLGGRFSILTMWDGWAAGYRKTLQHYGLLDRLASIRSIGVEPDLRNLLHNKPEAIPRLIEAAMACIHSDGADVLILGSTTMHEAHHPIAEAVSAPVINPGPAAFKLAEAMIALGLRHSRNAYPASSVGSAEALAAMACRARGDAS
jgi:allantoin racemase